jgi:hypothetical protein
MVWSPPRPQTYNDRGQRTRSGTNRNIRSPLLDTRPNDGVWACPLLSGLPKNGLNDTARLSHAARFGSSHHRRLDERHKTPIRPRLRVSRFGPVSLGRSQISEPSPRNQPNLNRRAVSAPQCRGRIKTPARSVTVQPRFARTHETFGLVMIPPAGLNSDAGLLLRYGPLPCWSHPGPDTVGQCPQVA